MDRFYRLAPAVVFLAALDGCAPPSAEVPTPRTGERTPYSVQRPAEAGRVPAVERRNGTDGAGAAEISWETPRDERFAKFVRDHSDGMIRKAAVGVEQNGLVQIELDKSVAPDDTLGLTKSVMAGARKDFPGKPITLKVFDPGGEPILTARYRPDHGVTYHLAHGDSSASGREQAASSQPIGQGPQPADPLARSGVTEKDRKFAAWAEEHGRSYLRYVQADLERHGRLWFGVTPEVKPADLQQLTKSLLEGASTEFPKRELIATVFDPEGERIGKAHLDARGGVRWED